MSRIVIVFALVCAGLSVVASGSYSATSNNQHQDVLNSSAGPVNPVVQWNRAHDPCHKIPDGMVVQAGNRQICHLHP